MAKWVSPLFTDIRNKLGDAVVFSIWKGRPYFRTYVKPANPRTLKQQAHRDVLRQLVKRYQEISADLDVKAAWNKEALSFQLSGYNLFIKFGRLSSISVPGTASGTGQVEIEITYTLGLPANKAHIFRFDGTTWVDITPEGGLSSEPNSKITDTIDTSGTYEYWIADADVLKEGDTVPQPYQAITKWSHDVEHGVAKEAKVEVTIS